MPVEPKIVLHLPVSNEALLPAFVDRCLATNVSLIAIVGEGCAEMEDKIDDLIVGDGADQDRFITTSSHPGEPLEEVVEFATMWWVSSDGPTEIVRL